MDGCVSGDVDATILEPSSGWKERGGAKETAYPCIYYAYWVIPRGELNHPRSESKQEKC